MIDRDINRAAVENMSFTLGTMAALKTSRAIFFEGDAFALATGTDAASENWAFFPSRNLPLRAEQVKRVCSFFEELSLPFVWPVFHNAGRQILEDAGLFSRGELQVMSRQLSNGISSNEKNSLVFEINERPDVWAETAWTAFDSPPGAPASFVDLARGLMGNKNFFLILARSSEEDRLALGSAMLALSGASAGVYYFATLPEQRKKGVGDAMMREIVRIATELGCHSLTLQATPSGAPFYAPRGFMPLFKLPLHSFSEEVF